MIEKTLSAICRNQTPVNHHFKNGLLVESLRKDESITIVPIVDDAGDPVGLVDKQTALNLASNPLHYAAYQNRSVRMLMSEKFMSLDINTPIDVAAAELLNNGFSLSKGGFLITQDGHYVGVGACTDTLSYLVELNTARAIEMAELNEEVMDSVRYASRIQMGLLPTREKLEKSLRGVDVIWEPRDIVGGDVYWRSEDTGQNFFTIGLIDCTGHGVPGALMSMIVLSILNRIYSEDPNVQPGAALAKLGNLVRAALNQNTEKANSNDGFDAGLCKIDLDSRKMQFAGARNNCFAVPLTDEPILRLAGEKLALGYPGTQPYEALEEYEIEFDKFRTFCLASDGVFDQPGGPSRIAFGPKRFMDFLNKNRHEKASFLMSGLKKTHDEWRGTELRRDDLSALCFSI